MAMEPFCLFLGITYANLQIILKTARHRPLEFFTSAQVLQQQANMQQYTRDIENYILSWDGEYSVAYSLLIV